MFLRLALRLFLASILLPAAALAQTSDPASQTLGPADVIKITVHQNPDLSLETRVSETGQISFPLLGSVDVGGLTVAAAEESIARQLRERNFVRRPQVNILVVQLRSAQASVLGQVGRPGRYPIEIAGSRVSEMIAIAGGLVPGASEVVILKGVRNGAPVQMEIDLPTILQSAAGVEDPVVVHGDSLFVDRAPVVYIHGEVQRPGAFRLERGMTLMQGLAQGGGLTRYGTQRGIRIHRRDGGGRLQVIELAPTDLLARDDVIYVRESLF